MPLDPATVLADDPGVRPFLGRPDHRAGSGAAEQEVVRLEPAELVAAAADEVTGLRRLYVCLTRAVSSLVVVHQEPLPAPGSAPTLISG